MEITVLSKKKNSIELSFIDTYSNKPKADLSFIQILVHLQ